MTSGALIDDYAGVAADAVFAPDILVLATEWEPTKGGISVFNQQLCWSLAEAGARVICRIPPDAQGARLDRGVLVLPGNEVPGYVQSDWKSSLLQPVAPPEGPFRSFDPVAIFGHADKTGAEAKSVKYWHYPNGRVVHFVHTDVALNRRFKDDNPYGAIADKERQDFDSLLKDVLPVGVGPRLTAAAIRVRTRIEGPEPHCFVPGFTATRAAALHRPNKRPTFLVISRFKDMKLKGVDIACEALKRLAPRFQDGIELRVRGCDAKDAERVKWSCVEWIGEAHVDVLPCAYSPTRVHIERDLAESRALLMPSCEEGFGLAAWEAIGYGCPTLISNTSGLADQLRSHYPAAYRHHVVQPHYNRSRQIDEWVRKILEILDDPTTTQALCAESQQLLGPNTWDHAAKQLIDRIRRRDDVTTMGSE